MRKNVTIGFSDEEHLRILGAAAMARLPVATYLKWLLQTTGPSGEASWETSLVLARMDEMFTVLNKVAYLVRQPLPGALHANTPPSPRPPPLAPRELFETKLRQRGIPSSTIRQITIVLDEIEARP